MKSFIKLVAILAICHAPVQSRGGDQPGQPATLARPVLLDGRKQVSVRAQMIEVSLTKMREAGLKYPELAGSPLGKNDAKSSSDGHSDRPALRGIVNPGHPLFAFFDELEKKAVAKTIADPTLIALIGLDAHFHSGGQIPVLQQRVNGKLSTESATFGSELTFKSEALGNDRIRLTVKPRFAELDKSLQVSVGGRIVPGLNVRECQASAELASGDTMVLGGMPSNIIEYSNRDGVIVEKVVEKELLVLVTATVSDVSAGGPAKSVAHGESGYYYGGSQVQQPVLLARPPANDSPARTGEKK